MNLHLENTDVLFQLSIFGPKPNSNSFPKSARNQIWTPLLLIKKTAATPTFCKQNFCLACYVGETNDFGRKSERNWSLVSFQKSIVKIIHQYSSLSNNRAECNKRAGLKIT